MVLCLLPHLIPTLPSTYSNLLGMLHTVCFCRHYFSVCSECQIFKTFFSHYISQTFLSESKYILICISVTTSSLLTCSITVILGILLQDKIFVDSSFLNICEEIIQHSLSYRSIDISSALFFVSKEILIFLNIFFIF